MRGRVFGVVSAVAFGGASLGLIAGGFLIESFGLFPTILGMGICYLAVTLSMLFNPALKRMDRSVAGRGAQTQSGPASDQ